MQRNSPGLTPRLRFSMMVLPPSCSVTASNATCGLAPPETASRRFAALAMVSALVAWGIDEVERRAQMRFQHGLRARNVARQHAVGKQLVAAHEPLAAVEGAHHHAAIAVGLVVEVGVSGEQALRAAGRQQGGMKALVQPVEILGAFAEFFTGAFDMAAHLMQRAENAGFPDVNTMDDGEAEC